MRVHKETLDKLLRTYDSLEYTRETLDGDISLKKIGRVVLIGSWALAYYDAERECCILSERDRYTSDIDFYVIDDYFRNDLLMQSVGVVRGSYSVNEYVRYNELGTPFLPFYEDLVIEFFLDDPFEDISSQLFSLLRSENSQISERVYIASPRIWLGLKVVAYFKRGGRGKLNKHFRDISWYVDIFGQEKFKEDLNYIASISEDLRNVVVSFNREVDFL